MPIVTNSWCMVVNLTHKRRSGVGCEPRVRGVGAWKTYLPRLCSRAISAMSTGAATEAKPTPRPTTSLPCAAGNHTNVTPPRQQVDGGGLRLTSMNVNAESATMLRKGPRMNSTLFLSDVRSNATRCKQLAWSLRCARGINRLTTANTAGARICRTVQSQSATPPSRTAALALWQSPAQTNRNSKLMNAVVLRRGSHCVHTCSGTLRSMSFSTEPAASSTMAPFRTAVLYPYLQHVRAIVPAHR